MENEGAQIQDTTYRRQLRQGEHLWAWKFGLRVIVCVLDLVAIGCAADSMARQSPQVDEDLEIFFSGASIAPGIIAVCGVSLIWSLVWILVLLLQRPPRAAHPGIAVGIDLILWICFVGAALSATVAILSIASFGDNPSYLPDPSSDFSGDYNYQGNYYLASNNTWVYNITSVSGTGNGGPVYNATTGTYNYTYSTPPSVSSVHRNCQPLFTGCTAQDDYINALWHSKLHREATGIVLGVTQWLLLLLHFALFVWACVDTHRHRKGVYRRKMNTVAERIVQDMQAKGLITIRAPLGTVGETTQPLMREHQQQAGEAQADGVPEPARWG